MGADDDINLARLQRVVDLVPLGNGYKPVDQPDPGRFWCVDDVAGIEQNPVAGFEPFDAYAAEVARVDQNGDGIISPVEGDIEPVEVKAKIDRRDPFVLIDVREPHEYQICNLNGHLIPLGELTRRVHELDSSREIVAHCRSGKRSAEAVEFLRSAGFRKVLNLKGGILAWSDEVDASVPKY